MSGTIDFAALRAPFPPEQLGKLPRVTCKACSDFRQQCDRHEKQTCDICGSYISTKHIHLDYVGHADVTSRLLEVDPEWTWAPKATDVDPELLKAAIASGNADVVQAVIDNAPPKFETDREGRAVGLWITLTVGGVTRLGVGSCPAGQFDAEKVLIGDALRNAAMRFGVAVDLWAKGDRADPSAENAVTSGGQAARGRQRQQWQDRRPANQVPRQDRPADRPQSGREQAASARRQAPLDPEDQWQIAIDGAVSADDTASLREELARTYAHDDPRTAQVSAAIDAREAALKPAGGERESTFVRAFRARIPGADETTRRSMRIEIAKAVSAKTITPDEGNALNTALREAAEMAVSAA